MELITDMEIIEEIKNGCNVLVKAMTPWHANSIEAAYMGLDIDIAPNIIVLCSYISPAECKIDESNFPYLKKIGARFYKYDITRFVGLKSKIAYLGRQIKQVCNAIQAEKKIYVFSQIVVDAYWNTLILENINDISVYNVIVDEGVETYVPRKKYDSSLKKCIAHLYEKKFPFKKDTLFFDDGRINNSIIQRYRDVYANHIEHIDEKDLLEISNSVLICFAPINEVKEMPVDEAKELIKKIVDCIHKNNVKVAVKLHPRETEKDFFETIGCYVLKSTGVSLEVLIEKTIIKPKMIVGLITTGLITANVFWNIKAVSFLKYVNSTSTPKKHRDFNKRFINTFEKYIDFVDNFEKFEEIVKEDKDNE